MSPGVTAPSPKQKKKPLVRKVLSCAHVMTNQKSSAQSELPCQKLLVPISTPAPKIPPNLLSLPLSPFLHSSIPPPLFYYPPICLFWPFPPVDSVRFLHAAALACSSPATAGIWCSCGCYWVCVLQGIVTSCSTCAWSWPHTCRWKPSLWTRI